MNLSQIFIRIIIFKLNIAIVILVILLTGCTNNKNIHTKNTMSQNINHKLNPILKLDTQGHTATIKDIIVTKNGELISASDDKTIRVWDIISGKEKRMILGNIGIGLEGMIFAIALSGDERYLAVGGFLDKPGHGNSGIIRIYNYQSGKLIKILKSHANVVLDLSFSKDDRFLISGSFDKTAKIWDVENNFTLYDTLRYDTKQIYATKIIKKDNNYFAITAGFNNKITLYDIGAKRVIKSDRLPYKLMYLATNKKHIAVCGTGKEIKIYDYNLKSVKTIKNKTMPSGLAYSRDGKYLIAGASAYPFRVNIYKSNSYKLKQSFKKHTNLTMAVTFWQNKNKLYGVSGGGNNNNIYIWNARSSKVKGKIIGAGKRVWSVGIIGDEIAWGNRWSSDYGKSRLQKSINLKTFKINTRIKSKQFKKIFATNHNYTLVPSKGLKYELIDAVLNINKNNITKAKIIKDSYSGYRHNCYGWYGNLIISGGVNGQLKVYNKNGEELASLVAHTAEVWSIAIDGDRLVSGSSDQTIRVWDLSVLRQKSSWLELKPKLNIFVSRNDEFVAWTNEGFFTASKKGAKYIGYYINQGINKEAQFIEFDKLYDSFYRPDLVAKALDGDDISTYAKEIDIQKILIDINPYI
jgi:WD40 repeat protein